MHPLVAAQYSQPDPTINAAQTGDSMVAGSQNVPISELYGAFDDPSDGKTGRPDPQEYVNERRMSPALLNAQDGPAIAEAAPDRPAQISTAYTFVKDWGALGYFTGQKGEVNAGAAQPPGLMAPVGLAGNTFRLAPMPWDSSLWVAQYPQVQGEGHAP